MFGSQAADSRNEWYGGDETTPSEALAINPRSRVARWRPGSRMAYSNSGYTIAGLAIAAGPRRGAGWGGGIALGDVNNDGLLDLFVASSGPNALYINQGDGTFVEAGTLTGSGYTWFAVMSVAEQVRQLKDVNSFFGNLRNGGMVAMDYRTGDILAYVGSAGYVFGAFSMRLQQGNGLVQRLWYEIGELSHINLLNNNMLNKLLKLNY